jgi:D-sedoheptulose 7-phosphate isomerase
MEKILKSAIDELSRLLKPGAYARPLEQCGQLLLDCWKTGGKLLTCGNGGSAADAMHLAEELVVRYKKNRKALGAIALMDPTMLTCAGNDFGYESVFSRQIEALGRKGDVLVIFTTSGNSPNVVRAVEAAKKSGMKTVAMLGNDGGKLRGTTDIEFIIPSTSSARVQEVHQVLYHALCEWIDARVDSDSIPSPSGRRLE